MVLTAFHGFCMALADSVPGVSGGTIAFILGFYDRFLDALHQLFGTDTDARRAAVRYLLQLGLGWVVGMVASVAALAELFASQVYFMSLVPVRHPGGAARAARTGPQLPLRPVRPAARRASDAAADERRGRRHPLCRRAGLDAGLHFRLRRRRHHRDGAAGHLRLDAPAHRGRSRRFWGWTFRSCPG